MKIEQIEVYSDASNAAIMRHPGRRFPGVLVQGDTLHALCRDVDEMCAAARESGDVALCKQANALRNKLLSLLTHYKIVLGEHDIPLPFSE